MLLAKSAERVSSGKGFRSSLYRRRVMVYFLSGEALPMSMHPKSIEPVPEETARIARAAFPMSNRYLRLRDELGSLYTDEAFADLFPTHGQPAEARHPPRPGVSVAARGRQGRCAASLA